jgi:hypothetical protein
MCIQLVEFYPGDADILPKIHKAPSSNIGNEKLSLLAIVLPFLDVQIVDKIQHPQRKLVVLRTLNGAGEVLPVIVVN